MIIFISPAKGFNQDLDSLPKDILEYIDNDVAKTLPALIDKTRLVMDELKKFSVDELTSLMKVNPDIADLNYNRFSNFKFDACGLPSLFAYSGIQYKAINPSSLDRSSLDYLQEHLFILSGLYGPLIPLDRIYPYRLEMQTRLCVDASKNLYNFWGDSIYQLLKKELETQKISIVSDSNAGVDQDGNIILNLASTEYSKAIKKYIEKDIENDVPITYVSCNFKQDKNGVLKSQSTASKTARGLMVRYLAQNKIDTIEGLKSFKEDGYTFKPDLSTEDGRILELVFVK